MEKSSFPFLKLPIELQLEVLSKLPITERQIIQVAKRYKDLIDKTLISKIKDGDLYDPTTAIPDRIEYFKAIWDKGEYFKPSPGLWPSIINIRNTLINENPEDEYALIYGTIFDNISVTGSFKFVTLVSFKPEEALSIFDGIYHTTISFKPVPNKIPSTVGILLSTMPEITNETLIKRIFESTIPVPIKFSSITVTLTLSNYNQITGLNMMTFRTSKANIIHIPKHYIRNGTLIMPSLRDHSDVYILQ